MPSLNHDLLLMARQFRGMSQAEVAEAAGLDQGHYSRVERGLLNTNPSVETLSAIADALRFRLSFFQQPDDVAGLPLSVHDVAWRKKASVSAGELKRLHAELNIRVMHIRRLLTAVDVSPELPLPRFDADEEGGADQVARLVRRAWGLHDGPIKHLSALCERAGVLVIVCDFPENVDGLTMRLRDIPPVVFLNRKSPPDRMRFSLAHELGHLIMHSIPSDRMEEEADTFAGELLVPGNRLRADLIGGRVTLERLVQLKLYWRVSVASLLYRAGTIGVVSRNQSDYLWRQLSARGWRKTEPPETQFERETVRLFSGILKLHTDQMKYTVEDFGRMFHVYEDEIRKLYALESEEKSRYHLRIIK